MPNLENNLYIKLGLIYINNDPDIEYNHSNSNEEETRNNVFRNLI